MGKRGGVAGRPQTPPLSAAVSPPGKELREGIVATVHGTKCWVLDGAERVECFLRGKVVKDRSLTLVVGDRVTYEPLGAGQGVVAAVSPRRTELRRSVREASRRVADRRGGGRTKGGPHAQDQVVLANADQAVLVVAAREPGIDLERLDRSLALARASGLSVAIVVNKMDLADAEAMQALMQPYAEMGIPLLYLSAAREEGLAALREMTRDQVSLFWGGSGVGKSTLSGKLTGRAIKVGVWNEKNPRGPHTTTDSCLYPLPYGGYLADTPGFDTLLLDTLAEEAHPEAWLLPEAERQTARCRFSNCTHRGEPGCAVKGGVLEGDVDRRRYRRYLTLAAELGEAGDAAGGDAIVLVGGELFRRLQDSDRDDLVEAWTGLGKTSWCYYWPFLRCYDTPNRQVLWRKIGDNWCLFVARSTEKGEQLNLLFPPLGPTPEEALPECLKLLRAVNGKPRAKIMWLDEEDASGLRGYRGVKLRGKGSEYWYRPEEALALDGGRFRTVRRQIARLEVEHTVTTRPYTMADLPACLNLLMDWCDTQGSRYLRVLDREYTEAALRRYDRFSREELFGGVVEVDGEPRAFFLGGSQCPSVGHAFVMKADVEIPGLSYYTKRELISWLGDHAWVNDAGDLRSEGLRQFKQSFRPSALKPIYQAVVTW